MYKLPNSNAFFPTPKGVWNTSTGSFIPEDIQNIDYQAYLKWLEGYEQQFNPETHEMMWVKTSDGNTPLPADE